jgi:hypothetical protein
LNGNQRNDDHVNVAINVVPSNGRAKLEDLSAGKYACPSCRALTVDSKSLPENVALKELLLKAFPTHIETCEKLDSLKGKRLWIKFLQARKKLESFKSRRERLHKELVDLGHQMESRRLEFSGVASECVSELHNARVVKGMLDSNAYILSVDDRRSLAALAHPEEQLLAIDDTLNKLDRSTPLSVLD